VSKPCILALGVAGLGGLGAHTGDVSDSTTGTFPVCYASLLIRQESPGSTLLVLVREKEKVDGSDVIWPRSLLSLLSPPELGESSPTTTQKACTHLCWCYLNNSAKCLQLLSWLRCVRGLAHSSGLVVEVTMFRTLYTELAMWPIDRGNFNLPPRCVRDSWLIK
jgi:hypothetical protein